MKRRAVVEPGISHLKHGHLMNRNRLKGTQGDQLNAVLSAAGMNFKKLLKRAAKTWLYIRWILKQAEIQLHVIFNPNNALYPRSLN
jgi:IS5 family transposase